MSEGKVCPILAAGCLTSGRDDIRELPKCLEEGCALYDSSKGQCMIGNQRRVSEGLR